MTHELDPDLQLKLATEIAVSFISRNDMAPADVPTLVFSIREALARDLSARGDASMSLPSQSESEGSRPHSLRLVTPGEPAVPVSESVTDDYLISLEDGRPYRSLRRHLMAKYGMTPDDYRRKWSLPPDYPMVAPSYAKDRSEVAKRIGLGRAATRQPPASAKPRSQTR